jgi:hypothetical protein
VAAGAPQKMSDWLFDWWLHRIVLGAMAIAFFAMAGVYIRLIFSGGKQPRSIGFFIASTIIVIISGLGAVWLMIVDSGIK